MKKFLYCVSLFLFMSSAWALETVSPRNACSRLQPQSNEDACYQVIANATFDELAVGVCDGLKGSKDTLNCMREIQHGTFESRVAIKVCNRMGAASNIIECLGAIEFEHIDDRAVLACDRIKDSDKALECMESIAGKKYGQSEINQCDSLSSLEEKVDCFEDSGKENPNDFELGGRKAAATTNKKRTLDLSQFIKDCPPSKNDDNSDIVNKFKSWDNLVRRVPNAVK